MSKLLFVKEVVEIKKINRLSFKLYSPSKHINVQLKRSEYSETDVEKILGDIRELKNVLAVPDRLIASECFKNVLLKPVVQDYLTKAQYNRLMSQIKMFKSNTSPKLYLDPDLEIGLKNGFLALKKEISLLQKKYAITFE